MLIALDYPLVDIQQRLGDRKPDTTLRIYAHQWKLRDTQKSQIGSHIGPLFAESTEKQLRTTRRRPLALPAAARYPT